MDSILHGAIIVSACVEMWAEGIVCYCVYL